MESAFSSAHRQFVQWWRANPKYSPAVESGLAFPRWKVYSYIEPFLSKWNAAMTRQFLVAQMSDDIIVTPSLPHAFLQAHLLFANWLMQNPKHEDVKHFHLFQLLRPYAWTSHTFIGSFVHQQSEEDIVEYFRVQCRHQTVATEQPALVLQTVWRGVSFDRAHWCPVQLHVSHWEHLYGIMDVLQHLPTPLLSAYFKAQLWSPRAPESFCRSHAIFLRYAKYEPGQEPRLCSWWQWSSYWFIEGLTEEESVLYFTANQRSATGVEDVQQEVRRKKHFYFARWLMRQPFFEKEKHFGCLHTDCLGLNFLDDDESAFLNPDVETVTEETVMGSMDHTDILRCLEWVCSFHVSTVPATLTCEDDLFPSLDLISAPRFLGWHG